MGDNFGMKPLDSMTPEAPDRTSQDQATPSPTRYPNIRRSTIVTAIALVGVMLARVAVEFADGYQVFPPSFIILLLLFLLALILSIKALLVASVALSRRHGWCALSLVVIGFACWFLPARLTRHSLFILGLSARMRHEIASPEIRQVAQRCLSLMPNGGKIIGPRKYAGASPEEEKESRRAWDAISSHRLVHLGDDACLIFVRPPDVCFEWGGALPGHWGLWVGSSHGDEEDYELGRERMRFDDGITLFRAE